MLPTVTAVLVARNGAQYLPRTLAALAAQTRRPDRVILVDAGSSDATPALLREVAAARLVSVPGRSFGAAVAHALHADSASQGPQEWLWLLGHDNAPAPGALAALLGAVEVAPSVAVAGPKLMRWDDPAVIAGFGETVTAGGRSVELVDGELDQAQHDARSDVLGVAAAGMLVRRSVWSALGGFDPGLPSVDAALDFCVRARLAGHRVVAVAAARVASAGPPELFGRRTLSAAGRHRLGRAAQLHRRLVWANPVALPVHWLSLVPLAVIRSLGQLVAKRPGWVGGELAAGFGAAFDGTVGSARRVLRRNRQVGWAAIAPLRMRWAELRERRAAERVAPGAPAAPRERIGFFSGGGAWIVLLAAVVGAIAFGRLVGAEALDGGGLVPLAANVPELWNHVGYGWRDVGSGFLGAADPFAYLLAALGSLTFWSPSLSIVALYLVALPLAALSAWWCAARFATRAWGPAVVAIAWMLAPPFLASLGTGHLGAVIAHILLPSLVLAIVNAARSWSASALAALAFAAVAASAPSIVPALLVGIVAWAAANPKAFPRVLGIPIPAAALFAPLVVEQFVRGTPLALFADPGLPVFAPAASGWHLTIGGGLAGWDGVFASLGLPAPVAPLVVVVLLAPLALLAVLAPFLPGAARGIPALVVALLGFVTAVAAVHLEVTMVGSVTTSVWPGAALSLYWLGLAGAVATTLDALPRLAAAPAIVASIGLVLLAVPGIAAAAAGGTDVVAGNGRLLPAFASAQTLTRPALGTLELTAQPDGGAAIALHRGQGTSLDEQSTLAATQTTVSDAGTRLAILAGNLASRSGFDIPEELDDLQIGFVLLTRSDDPGAAAGERRITEALDGNRDLTPIGETASGTLWYYPGLAEGAAPSGPGPLGTPLGIGIVAGQAAVFLVTLLLAIPTTPRRRLRTARVTGEETAPQDEVTG